MSVSIKTVLDENIHRFTLPQVSFEELEKALVTIYGKSGFSVRYQDEDGDLISVSSTPELQEALRGAEGKTLKLLLARESGKGAKVKVESEKLVEAEKVDLQVGEKIDAKRLAEYQKELEAAQQELKQAAEASRQAKQAAAQAFWEAEEARELARKEEREREELLFAKEQAEQQRREEEEAERAAREQQLVEETLQKIAQEEDEAMKKIAEREELERQKVAEAWRKFAEDEERERYNSALTAAAEKKAKAEAFWEAEHAREQAEKEARQKEEVVVKQEPCEDSKEACHANVQCNLCNVFPIIGTRYQCTVCHDFDLCAKCEASPQSHPLDHPLLKHKQPISTATIHSGVSCDNCGVYPIVGPRFNCKVCPNFDLCADCESKDVHAADHPLFKFRLEKPRECRFGRGGFRLLMQGSFGPRVRKLQERLGVQVDGFFGPKTEEAVKQFQAAHGLAVDGVVGPQTRGKMGAGASVI